jgi:hypothetical protein
MVPPDQEGTNDFIPDHRHTAENALHRPHKYLSIILSENRYFKGEEFVSIIC